MRHLTDDEAGLAGERQVDDRDVARQRTNDIETFGLPMISPA